MIKDYFKCEKCEYKENRKRGVIKCVFLSIIFCVLAFVLGVAVGMQVPAQTAQNTMVTASAEEVTPTPSKWNPNWVQAPADWDMYNDYNNSTKFDILLTLIESAFSPYLSDIESTFVQELNGNTLTVSGTVVSPMDNISFSIRAIDIVAFETITTLRANFSFYFEYPLNVAVSYRDSFQWVDGVAFQNSYLEYEIFQSSSFTFSIENLYSVGSSFSFTLSNLKFALYNSDAAVRKTDALYYTPNTYVCDYYYNLGLGSSSTPGGGYTEEDMQAEYDKGYAAGDSAGYDRGYDVGYADGLADAPSGGVSDEELQAEYERGYLEGYDAGVSYAVDMLLKPPMGIIDFYNTNYFPFLYSVVGSYPAELSRVTLPFADNEYYIFAQYYEILFNDIQRIYNLNASERADLYDCSSTFEIRFNDAISPLYLSQYRFFRVVNDMVTYFFEGTVGIEFTDGTGFYAPFVFMPEGEPGDFFYNSFALDLSVMPKSFENKIVAKIIIHNSMTLREYMLGSPNEQSNAGLYNVGFYDITSDSLDSISFARGFEEGEAYGKSISDAKVAKENYQKGYSAGLAKAETFDFTYAVSTVVGAPVQVVKEFLNFEILGVNMISFISGVITLLIIIKCLKLIL